MTWPAQAPKQPIPSRVASLSSRSQKPKRPRDKALSLNFPRHSNCVCLHLGLSFLAGLAFFFLQAGHDTEAANPASLRAPSWRWPSCATVVSGMRRLVTLAAWLAELTIRHASDTAQLSQTHTHTHRRADRDNVTCSPRQVRLQRQAKGSKRDACDPSNGGTATQNVFSGLEGCVLIDQHPEKGKSMLLDETPSRASLGEMRRRQRSDALSVMVEWLARSTTNACERTTSLGRTIATSLVCPHALLQGKQTCSFALHGPETRGECTISFPPRLARDGCGVANSQRQVAPNVDADSKAAAGTSSNL